MVVKVVSKMKTAARGFTLVELLVVISIIAVLSVVGFVSFQAVRNSAADAKVKADLDAIKKAYESNYDPTLNGGQGGYKPLTDAMFASGKIPTQPNGSPYPCAIGPENLICAVFSDQGYQISAILSNTTTLIKSTQGTLDVSSVATCDKLTSAQACNVWSAAVLASRSTIYIDCADIPSTSAVLPIDCTGANNNRKWAVPYYYTQPYGGERQSLNPIDYLGGSNQTNTIWQASHGDGAMRNPPTPVNVQLHFPGT